MTTNNNIHPPGGESALPEVQRLCLKAFLVLLFIGASICSRAEEFLVKNINAVQETAGSAPSLFVPVGNNIFYFKANDGIHGTELWRSDGTDEGTTLVADILANNASADPTSLVNLNGTLFFTATDSTNGRELWTSDGTAAGTTLVANINPGSASSNPTNLVVVGNLLFFSATTTNSGTELWVSDGTAAGTVLVREIGNGTISSNPQSLTVIGNKVFFTANNTVNGIELWSSDGTTAGTTLVKDINTGSASSSPANLVNVDGTLFFSANTGTNVASGIELWKSDGTSINTVMVKDINPGSASSNPTSLVNVGGTLFFSANGGPLSGIELWKSDGTTAGTVQVKEISTLGTSSSPQNLINVGGTLFFTANAGTNATPNAGTELWKSDGTEANTVLVKDIFPGVVSSGISNLVNLNGTLFFSANNGSSGAELWKSDGTESGTVMVKDIRAGSLSSAPQNLANINGTLVFSADDGIVGRELWKSDGTEAGTEIILNIRNTDGNSNPANMVNLNGTLIFAADNGFNNTELWKSDGTLEGTVLLKEIATGTNSNPANLVLVNDTVFFSADDGIHGRELWKTDGTEAGTVLIKDINPAGNSTPINMVNFNGILFFSAIGGTNSGGTELWMSDGTADGTMLVKEINPGIASSNPTNLVVIGNTLLFSATTTTNGIELWKSDGTTAGTVLVKDINPGSGSSIPSNMAVFNNTLYFTANNSLGATNTGVGIELWKSDGTEAGTVLVKDINPGTASSNPQRPVAVGNLLFFAASNGNNVELWKTDGTEVGTVMVKDIRPGANSSSNPQNLINVNGTLFFSAIDDPANAIELWKSDGTEAGTVMVKDINPGVGGSSPTNFVAINGILYFSANDSVNGLELWQSDGTADGTFMVADITGDSAGSSPGPFTVIGNNLFFAATQPLTIGRELFGFVLNHAPVVLSEIPNQEGVFGASFSFTIPEETFADEDAGQTLTYSASNLPTGISFQPETGTFSGTFAAAGEFTVVVTATDNGGPIPLSVTSGFVVTVQKATPVVSWTAPADITYGTALSGSQLSATANVSGSFAYAPAAGTILHAASDQTLSVSFTPQDSANYNTASATVSINVLKALLTTTADNHSRTYGSANPALTISYSGFVNGDTASALDSLPAASTTATQASPVGSYPITLTGGSDNDYSLTLVNGTLNVTPASLIVTANDATKTYGQTNPAFTGVISGIQNGDAITATYSSTATDTSLAGTYPIVPALVDTDSKLPNYSVTLVNGTLAVSPAPLVVTITSPASGYVQSVGTNILFTGTFTKSGASDSYAAYWTFSSDGMADTIVSGTVSNETVSAQLQFTASGIYTIKLTVTNDFGASTTATNVNNDLPAYIVIYDPEGGFASGGGWFNSPAGAYALDTAVAGKVTFGFVTKYHQGATIPSGQTRFQFKLADLDFRSTSYDWLVISGSKAQYTGSGTINGEGDYAFKLTAVDGDANGGGGTDTLRMRIWEKEHNILIYDNQFSAPDSSTPTTAIQAGSIVIHKD